MPRKRNALYFYGKAISHHDYEILAKDIKFRESVDIYPEEKKVVDLSEVVVDRNHHENSRVGVVINCSYKPEEDSVYVLGAITDESGIGALTIDEIERGQRLGLSLTHEPVILKDKQFTENKKYEVLKVYWRLAVVKEPLRSTCFIHFILREDQLRNKLNKPVKMSATKEAPPTTTAQNTPTLTSTSTTDPPITQVAILPPVQAGATHNYTIDEGTLNDFLQCDPNQLASDPETTKAALEFSKRALEQYRNKDTMEIQNETQLLKDQMTLLFQNNPQQGQEVWKTYEDDMSKRSLADLKRWNKTTSLLVQAGLTYRSKAQEVASNVGKQVAGSTINREPASPVNRFMGKWNSEPASQRFNPMAPPAPVNQPIPAQQQKVVDPNESDRAFKESLARIMGYAKNGVNLPPATITEKPFDPTMV